MRLQIPNTQWLLVHSEGEEQVPSPLLNLSLHLPPLQMGVLHSAWVAQQCPDSPPPVGAQQAATPVPRQSMLPAQNSWAPQLAVGPCRGLWLFSVRRTGAI